MLGFAYLITDEVLDLMHPDQKKPDWLSSLPSSLLFPAATIGVPASGLAKNP